MKQQISKRLCAPLVHDALEGLCNGTLEAREAAGRLCVSRSRLYQLRGDYLRVRAEGRLAGWMPGVSGGDRAPGLPREVEEFLREALRVGYSYAFAASEAGRLFGVEVSRSLVRRWARGEGLWCRVPARTPAHTRRWHRGSIGELWQLDASLHRWFGADGPLWPLLDMIDDASRLQVGVRLCRSEDLAAYIDFLRRAFQAHGLPLALYVDNAAVFAPRKDGSPSALGLRLALCGVSLIYANSPQAKGKVERVHQVWQDRLVPHFRLMGYTPQSDLAEINSAIDSLARHRNSRESHREIGSTPLAAWRRAEAENRSKLRPVPKDGWWPHIWSLWHNVTASTRGTIFHNGLRFPTQRLRNGEKAILCEHFSGHYSVIKGLPGTSRHPDILFTNLP